MSDARESARLPERPHLDHLKKEAKELRASAGHPTLSAAQLALARRYGFPSWAKLKLAVEQITLRRLLAEGDAEKIRDLLASSPRLASAPFADGSTPLHLAAQRNDADLVEVLVQHGAPLESRYGRSAHSALSWAITVEAFDAAKKLIELGLEPDLFCAAGLDLLEKVQSFWDGDQLRRRPSRTGSSRTTEGGEALPRPPKDDRDQVSDALYIACRTGRLATAGWLLDHGADPNWRGYCGATCLAWAEYSGVAELCALLRQRGGSDDLLDHEFKAAPRAFGVMVLAGWGFTPARLVARLTADRSLVKASGGRGTLLHAAAAGGQTVSAKILLAFGADRAARNSAGQTPAEVAEAGGHRELAELLR